MKTTKQKRLFMLVPVWLLLFGLLLWAGTASAGWNDFRVSTEGKGITVYSSSSGSSKAGILYNGYGNGLSLESTNGRYECDLTLDYSVWVNQEKAESLIPQWTDKMENDEYEALMENWEKNRPCNMFMVEVVKDDTPVYSSPGHKHVTVRHKKGTLLLVCGEFGNDYYVEERADGFVAKDAVRKVSDLKADQINNAYEDDSLPVQTLYASETEPVYKVASAGAYGDDSNVFCYTSNQKVRVLCDLGDWVQLSGGGFVEKRFLDPEGAHSYPTAWVKCDGALDRLNLRWCANTDYTAEVKLCSGVPVHVITQTEKWAVVFVTGPNGGYNETGCVMKEYLSFNGKDIEYSGITQVRLKENVNARFSNYGDYSELPAGTLLNVIGVFPSSSSHSDSTEHYLCETEDGRYIEIQESGVLEPVNTETGIFAKVSSAVRMRTEPDPEAKVLHQVKAKTKVEVLLRGEIWTIVKYKNEIGYMMSRYLSFP
ncbi:MAG: SH3 domain-containing protein [Clostridia bacterium]|nr:SH3 domain-containing protein [Clostridia bacterium]